MNEREKRVRELEDAIAETIGWIEAIGTDDWRGNVNGMLQHLRDLIRVPEPQQRQVIGAHVDVPPNFGDAMRERQALREMARLLDLIPHQLTLNACPKCYGRMERVPVSIGITVGGSVATAEYTLPLRCARPGCDGGQSTRDPTYQLTPAPAPDYSNIPRPQTLDDVRAQLKAARTAPQDDTRYLDAKPLPAKPWVPPAPTDPAIAEIRQQMHAAIEKLLHARCERCGGPMQIRMPDDPAHPYVLPLRCAGGCND